MLKVWHTAAASASGTWSCFTVCPVYDGGCAAMFAMMMTSVSSQVVVMIWLVWA